MHRPVHSPRAIATDLVIAVITAAAFCLWAAYHLGQI
jgi:hypothetical protein